MRERQLRGPIEFEGDPELQVIQLRRYRCTRCRAVTAVGPGELLTRRLYSAAAIAYALALYAISGLSPRAVRFQVSPSRVVGATSAARWTTLMRWCLAVRTARLFRSVGPFPAGWRPRRVAERAAMMLASHALPSPDPPPVTALAFLGAARAA